MRIARPRLYRVTGLNSRSCRAWIVRSDYCKRASEKYDTGDLEDKRISPRDGREVTVRWALVHVMDHTIDHQRVDIAFIRAVVRTKRLYSQTHQTLTREILVA